MLSDDIKKTTKHEYDFDSSDEEDIRNTVGNVPMHWYDTLPHVGYDSTGRPIMRPGSKSKCSDAISKFLQGTATEDGEQASEWRTVIDPKTGQSVVLSDRDLEIVTKMCAGKGLLGDFEDDLHQPWDDFFSKDVLEMPITAHPPQKRSFIPSLLDRRRVGRITHAMKMGWIQPRLPAWALDDVEDPDKLRRYSMYMSSGKPDAFDDDEGEILGFSTSALPICVFPDVWADEDDVNKSENETFAWKAGLPASLQTYRPPRPRPFMRPAAEPLPNHAESYNPPPEFLLSEEEERAVMRAWRDRMKDNQATKVVPTMPRKFDCLRHVPFSQRYFKEREERVKDMIMASRVEKQQVHTTPEALLPEIPSLSELRPYPSHLGLEYKSHTGRVTALSISPCGQWLASISPVDSCLRIWETSTNFCFRCYQLGNSTMDVRGRRSVAGGLFKTARRIEDSQDDDDEDDEDESTKRPSAYVAWNPNPELCLVAAAIGQRIYIINPVLGDKVNIEKTDTILRDCWKNHLALEEAATMAEPETKRAKTTEIEEKNEDEEPEEQFSKQALTTWSFQAADENAEQILHSSLLTYTVSWDSKLKKMSAARAMARSKTMELSRISIEVHQPVVDLSWHPKGDYLLTLSMSVLSNESRSRSSSRLLLHRISRMISQAPFTANSTEEWRTAAFHPSGKPQLTVAGPKQVQLFDLVAQKELRRLKLDLPSDRLRCTFLHPSGDHIIAGTSDSRFIWFDVELGNVPFKKLRLNHGTVHKVHAHSCRPLVSVALDDGSLFILHCKVSDDLLSKPLIVPVQLIRTGYRHVFSTVFHNRLPHVYAGGEDGTIRQFVAWN